MLMRLATMLKVTTMAVEIPDEFNLPGRLGFATRAEALAANYRRMAESLNHLWARQAPCRFGGRAFYHPLNFTNTDEYLAEPEFGGRFRTDVNGPAGTIRRYVGDDQNRARLRFWIFGREIRVWFRVFRVERQTGGRVELSSFTLEQTDDETAWADTVIALNRADVELNGAPAYIEIECFGQATVSGDEEYGSLWAYFVAEDPFPHKPAGQSPGAAPSGEPGDEDPDDPLDPPDDPGEDDPPSDDPDDEPDDDPDDDPDEPIDPVEFLEEGDAQACWCWLANEGQWDKFDPDLPDFDEFFDFCEAPHGDTARGLNRLFVKSRMYDYEEGVFSAETAEESDAAWRVWYSDPQDGDDTYWDGLLDEEHADNVRAFNREAHARGMGVEYLDGQAIWICEQANAQKAINVLEDVITFNLNCDRDSERYDGIHYNIEPHTIGSYSDHWDGGWRTDGPNAPGSGDHHFNKDWCDNLIWIYEEGRRILDDYEDETGHHMTWTFDLPVDYFTYVPYLSDFFKDPSSPVDYITVINYHDNRDNENGDPGFFYGWEDPWNPGTHVGGVELINDECSEKHHIVGAETIQNDPQHGTEGDTFTFWKGDTGTTSTGPYDGYEGFHEVMAELIDDWQDTYTIGYAVHLIVEIGNGDYGDMDP